MSFKEFLENAKKYNKLLNAGSILRRYFAMNGFDGALTALGVIIGSMVAGVTEPKIVFLTTLSTAFALFISGSATYLTERAERLSDLNKLEKQMLTSLKDSNRAKATDFVALEAALVDGGSPFLMALIVLSPFALALMGIIPVQIAYYVAVGLSFLIIFLLGVFLGSISKQHKIALGMKMVFAGVIALIVSLALGAL